MTILAHGNTHPRRNQFRTSPPSEIKVSHTNIEIRLNKASDLDHSRRRRTDAAGFSAGQQL